MESTESFQNAVCSLPANGTAPVHSEKEHEQGGLFQVGIHRGSPKTLIGILLHFYVCQLTAGLFSIQRVVFPVEASLNRLLWNRSISPNSLLETSISEEVRPRDLEEEEATQALGPLLPPTTTSRRHTLAEVSARFHQCNPPCKLNTMLPHASSRVDSVG